MDLLVCMFSMLPEATGRTALSELTQLPLPGCGVMGGGRVGRAKWVCESEALFFLVGFATISTDFLGW